ncbi:MAG: dihydrodipicolinate synthase family protein [Chlorobia bacterium]|nr:dihydrodipicolinate synthase family protein [Fimbriimonadaceae bacterium]
MLELAGNFVPIVTPFTDDGSMLSEVRLARLLRWYLGQGVAGFAVATETGEFGTLTLGERKQLVELVQRETQNALPMIVNISTLATSACLDLAQHASRHGARLVTVIPPYFGAFTQSEHIEHVRVIANHSSLPIVVVDPQETLSEEATSAISHQPNVSLAWPRQDLHRSHADWFRCYGVGVDPGFGIPDSSDADFVLRNRAAVAKTLLLDFDLEVGSPRMPVQPIPYREIRKAG